MNPSELNQVFGQFQEIEVASVSVTPKMPKQKAANIRRIDDNKQHNMKSHVSCLSKDIHIDKPTNNNHFMPVAKYSWLFHPCTDWPNFVLEKKHRERERGQKMGNKKN